MNSVLSDRLFLYEEIALLSFHDDRGTVLTQNFGYAVASAILAELLLDGCIKIENGKKPLVTLIGDFNSEDPVIAEALLKITQAKRKTQIKTWVERIAGIKQLKRKVAQSLCSKGILQEEKGRVLFVFNRTLYPEIDSKPEALLVQRLENAIFSDDAIVDERTAIVISIANAIGLLPCIFEKKQLKQRKKRIEQISEGEQLGQSIKEILDAIQTAIMIAVIIPVVVSAGS